MKVLSSILPWPSRRRTITGAEVQNLRDRVSALERQTESLTARVAEVMVAVTRLERVLRLEKVEDEVVRIEADVTVRRIETEVRTGAARLKATTPHYQGI
jgi:hypothetical protein